MEKSDSELVEEYFNGDNNSLEILIRRHLKSVYNFVHHFVGGDYADDVTQEVFLKAWKNLKKYNRDRSFKTWLLSIAHNASVDWLRKKRDIRLSDYDSEDGDNLLINGLSDDEPLASEIFAKTEDLEALKNAINNLSITHREVLLLRYKDEMTFDEIGVIVGKPLHTVKSQHRRSLIKLRNLLSKIL